MSIDSLKAADFQLQAIQILRFRADDSEILLDDVVKYFDQIRVAAAITDGVELAEPAVITAMVLVDSEHNVVRVDGVSREPLSFQACTRSVLHHLKTIAVFEDAVIDQFGAAHDPDDLPENLAEQLNHLSSTPREPAVHVMKTRDTLTPGYIALAAEAPVQRTFIDDFTLTLDPTGKGNDVSTDLSTKSELPIAVLTRLGSARSVVAKTRAGRRSSTFLFQDRPPQQTLVSTFGVTEVEELLRTSTRLNHAAGAEVPPELEQALLAIDPDSPDFLAEVLATLELPIEAAAWLQGHPPATDIVTVEPKPTRTLLKDSLVSEFNDSSSDSSRFMGGFKRFLRSRPFLALGYGLTEIVLGLVFLIFGQDWNIWPVLRWAGVILWLTDGAATTAWAIFLIKARFAGARDTAPDEPA